MFCSECGTQNPDTNKFCKNCGKPLKQSPQPPAPPHEVRQKSVQSPPLPVPDWEKTQQQNTAVATKAKKGSLGLGIAGIFFGLVSWIRYPYVCGILAIVIGILVLSRPEKRQGKAGILAGIGIIFGLASIVTDVFYFIIFPAPTKFVF